MKYRIVKQGDNYYPQRKWLCFWRYYMAGVAERILYFTSLKYAEQFIEDRISVDKSAIVVKEY